MKHYATVLALALAASGCTLDELALPPVDGELPEALSELGFFEGDLADLAPAAGVHPYTVNAALWTDHAHKARFIALPDGESVAFADGEGWELPVGAAIVKAFYFPADMRDPDGARRIVETRLLVQGREGIAGHVYLWNDEQTEATRFPGGARTTVAYLDEQGEQQSHEYVVPNTNQCRACHARDGTMYLLGATTPQLNRDVERDGQTVNQLGWLADRGVFGGASLEPASYHAFAQPFTDGPTEPRARAWLHANCAHCHRPGGAGGSSGLLLLEGETDERKIGICKSPAAAGSGTGGFDYDILPGKPEQSIMPFRMASSEPAIKMPELANKLPDPLGLALIQQWIAELPPGDCNE